MDETRMVWRVDLLNASQASVHQGLKQEPVLVGQEPVSTLGEPRLDLRSRNPAPLSTPRFYVDAKGVAV